MSTALVLLLNNAAPTNNRARLHAEGCQMLNRGRGRAMKVVRDGDRGVSLQEVVDDLEEMGYPVLRCKCCK